MPDIKPFHGILYNGQLVPFGDVVAPPYDVISPQLQEELYRRDPHNVVRLILNRDTDPYASAAKAYSEWQRSGILYRDPAASLYVVAQSFVPASGAQIERRGFIGACRLEEIGKGSILPHEKTHAGP